MILKFLHIGELCVHQRKDIRQTRLRAFGWPIVVNSFYFMNQSWIFWLTYLIGIENKAILAIQGENKSDTDHKRERLGERTGREGSL
jgi:hypothetical protein